MEQKHNHHGGGNSGFLVGVIVGVIITLLFTTKRGRAVLKDITERGLEKFSDFEKLMRDTASRETYDEEETDYVQPETIEEVKPSAKPEENKKEVKQTEEAETSVAKVKEKAEEKPQKSSGGKRWFRGLRKKD